jgi:DNA-directed RNA polymerase subunit RPC12/RpoP
LSFSPRDPSLPVRQPRSPSSPSRAVQLHAADAIACPTCRALLRRVTSGAGALLATCEARGDAPAGARYGEPCGQSYYASTGLDGVAVVLPISKAELTVLSAGVVPPLRQALVTLGVLRERSPSAIPSYACSACQRPTLLTDLFAGVCRHCAGNVRAAS